MMHSWFRRGLVLPALALALSLTAAPVDGFGGKKKDSPTVVEDALAFVSTDRSRAIKILEEAISESPNSRDVDLLMVHAGEQQRLAGNRKAAHTWFSKVVQRGIAGADQSAARLGLALLEADSSKALSAMQQIEEREAIATQNADRYLTLAVDAAKKNDDRMVSLYSKKALTYAREDSEVLERVQETLQSLAKNPETTQVSAPLEGGSALERAENAYLSGDIEAAKREATKAVDSETGEAQERARGLLKNLESGPEDRGTIVVLLPLSGKYENAAKQFQAAFNYGYSGGSRKLVFVDSGGTPETAAAALEQAVTTRHAIAVVGPVLAEETNLVVAAAENLHVPLLSLSQSYEDTKGHYWSLQGMYTRGDQIEALVQYTTNDRQMKSFAIFAPDSPVGIAATDSFKAEVAKKGATISTSATYKADEKNLLPFAANLGNREGNINEIRRRIEANGGNPDAAVVPPVLDFDGIFIPDTANNTPLACAALAYHEFPMGDFVGRSNRKIPLLGLSWWNSPQLIATGNEYTRGALFTDVFSSTAVGDSDPFVAAFRSQSDHAPSSLEAAMIDAGKLLAKAAASPAATRPAFREALLTATISDAATGMTHIDRETLKADRTVRIYTFARSKIEQVGMVEIR